MVTTIGDSLTLAKTIYDGAVKFTRRCSVTEDEAPQFDASVTCPTCGAAIRTVKMDLRIVARYTCPDCGYEVLIGGGKPAS